MKLKRQIYLVILLWVEVGYSQEVGSGYNLDFSGNSSRVVFDNIYQNLELPFSMSAWIQLPSDATTSRQYFFASCWPDNKVYSGFWVAIGSNSLGVAYGDGGGALNPAFRRSKSGNFSGNIGGIWAHVAFVVEGSRNMRLYLNGVEITGSYSGSGNEGMVGLSDGKAQVGFLSNNNGDQFFRGKVDDIRLWDFALSTIEIRNTIASKISPEASGLIGYWTFDEGTGSNLEELISNEIGIIEGDVSWEVSGAPLGDESFFEYFEAGTKKHLFKNENDSFWISTESENWVGYHAYKVNEEPNSLAQSTIDMSNGYYGIFPIFEGGRSDEYRVDFGNAQCTIGNFRNGNSDSTWETAEQSDSSNYFSVSNIVEFAFETVPIKNLEGDFLLSDSYIVCEDDLPVLIDSNLDQEFVWSTGESSNSILVEIDGYYWAEYVTPDCEIIRDSTHVTILSFENDFLVNDSYIVCEDELPLLLESTLSQNITWNNGLVSESILVESEGFYWAEYVSDCGLIRDSVFVSVSKIESDFLSEDSYSLCKSDLPFPLVSKLDRKVSWSTGEKDSLILINSSGTYWAEYQSACGIIRDSVSVEIAELNDVFIPNVLTPNNDGINDCFIIDRELSSSGLLVFNRAGVEIFRSNPYRNNWCPDDLPSGVYFYQIDNTCYESSFKGYISVLK